MSDKNPRTRAELVRLRREQERAQDIQRAARQATKPVPPLVARAPKPRKKLAAPKPAGDKRRFQIALSMPRGNLHSVEAPKISRPRLGWRALSFAFIVLCGAALYLMFTLPEFRASEAHVSGNQILTSVEINSAIRVTDQPVFMLMPSELETRLRLDYPELTAVQATVSFPNTLSIRVFERKPVVRWEQADGYTWIAEDGVAFRPRGEMEGLISVVANSAPPALEGAADPLTPTPFISVEMVRALQGLAWRVPPGEAILYDEAYGFGWNDPRGWRAYFGATADNIDLKMRVYEQMVVSLTQRGIRPALINVTYPTAPYYRMDQ